jgi:colanic acid/amylovoran biosynthesis glycosyltransferase
VDGWLVPPGNVAALADAMREALTAESSRLEAMARHGRTAVEARHNISTEAAKLIGHFVAGESRRA